MKKFTAILLAALMIIAMSPAVFAATSWTSGSNISGVETISDVVNTSGSGTVYLSGTVTCTNSLTVSDNTTLIVTGSLTMTGDNAVLTIQEKGKLIVADGKVYMDRGSTFENFGSVDIQSSGVFGIDEKALGKNHGTIQNISRMKIDGHLYHDVTLPAPITTTYLAKDMWNMTTTTVTYNFAYYTDELAAADDTQSAVSPELRYLNASYTFITAATKIPVEHNTCLYIKVTPTAGAGDFIDPERLLLSAGGQTISCAACTNDEKGNNGIFCVRPTDTVQLNLVSTSYKDVVRIYKIELPRTEGYYVITKDGAVDLAEVEYGHSIQFRVVLSPEYDKSEGNYYVYVNSFNIPADDYGYFDITGPISDDGFMATAGGVQQDITIKVMGVTSNELVGTMGNIIDAIQQIFSVIKSIFQFFIDLFNPANLSNPDYWDGMFKT